jgi:hypothetical protein
MALLNELPVRKEQPQAARGSMSRRLLRRTNDSGLSSLFRAANLAHQTALLRSVSLRHDKPERH